MQNKKDWYCIKFDVPKNKDITALEFSKKMNLFLEQINEFNHSIVNGIDDTYTVASYLEDFESGSIKWWLVDKLNKVDDKAIDKFVESPIKTTIAGILKVAKKKTLEFLSQEGHKQIDLSERKEKIIAPIIKEIELKKEELNQDILFPKVVNIDENRLLQSLVKMSEISKELDENISFIDEYENPDKQIVIPKDLNDFITPLNIDYPENRKVQVLKCILTIKKPDLIGTSQWEVILNKKINVKINDQKFLLKVKNREIYFSSGDGIVCDLQISTILDKEYNVINTEYTVLKVLGIKDQEEQLTLFDKENEL